MIGLEMKHEATKYEVVALLSALLLAPFKQIKVTCVCRAMYSTVAQGSSPTSFSTCVVVCLSRLCDSESEHLLVSTFFVALALDPLAQWFQIAKTRRKN